MNKKRYVLRLNAMKFHHLLEQRNNDFIDVQSVIDLHDGMTGKVLTLSYYGGCPFLTLIVNAIGLVISVSNYI